MKPGQVETLRVQADRGWQLPGLRLERGKTYRFTATGRYQLAEDVEPWMSEPNGVTLRYCRGLPLGALLASVPADDVAAGDANAPSIEMIGLEKTWTPTTTGTLFLRINDFASQLHDNQGEAVVKIEMNE